MAKDSGGGSASRRPSDPKPPRGEKDPRRAQRPADIARRRTTAIAAAGLVAALALAGLFGLVVFDGDEDKPEPAKQGPSAAERLVRKNSVTLPGAGIALVRPRGWQSSARGRAVRLRGPKGGTAITVLAPPGARTRQTVLDRATEVIRLGLKDVKFLPSPTNQKVANLPARFARFQAKTPRGVKVEGLLAAVKGKSQLYLVQVVSRTGDEQRVAAQGVLNTLRLTK